MKLNDFKLYSIDLNILFVGGFAFLIGCFDEVLAIKYLLYLIVGTIVLGLLNMMKNNNRQVILEGK